jgi:2-dehydro-3-deoxyphosphogalactonate aldolase
MRAVLPSDAVVLPVGGISPDNMSLYYRAGANGFGLGSGLCKSGKTVEALNVDAQKYVATWRLCESQ